MEITPIEHPQGGKHQEHNLQVFCNPVRRLLSLHVRDVNMYTVTQQEVEELPSLPIQKSLLIIFSPSDPFLAVLGLLT